MSPDQLSRSVRRVVTEHARIDVDGLRDDDDLFRRGMSSHASVDVMSALEEELGVEFPDRLLRKATFSSIRSICDALAEIGVGDERSPDAAEHPPGP